MGQDEEEEEEEEKESAVNTSTLSKFTILDLDGRTVGIGRA